jgi:hypothetical protein
MYVIHVSCFDVTGAAAIRLFHVLISHVYCLMIHTVRQFGPRFEFRGTQAFAFCSAV